MKETKKIKFSGLQRAQTSLKRAQTMGLILSIALLSPGLSIYGQDYSGQRRAARGELAEYFNAQFDIEAALVSSEGPEWTEELFGKQLFGCPSQAGVAVKPNIELSFATGAAGAWAGAVDGINTKLTTADGVTGSGFAQSTNSTARIPGDDRPTELQFNFDSMSNLRRSLVDQAASNFDQCYSKLPDGSYSYEELMRRCPRQEVTREQQGQTCIVSRYGSISEPLADGSGFKAVVIEATVCDFVGWEQAAANTATNFTTCYRNRYEGTATRSGGVTSFSQGAIRTQRVRSRMARACLTDKRGRRLSPAKIQACVQRQMARRMADR